MPDQPKEPTADELIAEFKEKMRTHDFDSSRAIEAYLGGAFDKFAEEKLYVAQSHAALGRHVEAIMKHFKGL
jgi:transposase